MMKFSYLFKFILDLLLPPRCLICRQIVYQKNGLCPDCFKKIRFLSNQSCPVCGRPYTFGNEINNNIICGKCLTKPPKLQGLKAVFAYDDNSKELILPLKHADRTDLVSYLSYLMYQRGKETLNESDIIIPVPLHWTRLIKRKFNQSSLLAVQIEKLSFKKCLTNVLIRTKKTQSQGHLTKKERKKNIEKAFMVKKSNLIKGKKIVLIDDVYTSGATLNECADTLLKAGAKQVKAIVLARVCFFE